MKFSQQERDAYEGRLKWLRAEAGALDKKFKEGVNIGIEKGEKAKTIEIAKNLLNQGLEVNIITKTTGLSEEEVEELRS